MTRRLDDCGIADLDFKMERRVNSDIQFQRSTGTCGVVETKKIGFLLRDLPEKNCIHSASLADDPCDEIVIG